MLGFVVCLFLFVFVLQIYVFAHFYIKKCLKNDYLVFAALGSSLLGSPCP